MNDQQLDKKIELDATKVKKDISTLVGDSASRLGRLDENITQAAGKAKDDVTAWVEGGVSKLRGGFEKLSGDARDTAIDTAEIVKKEVGYGLSEFNTKAQEVADKIPGDFGKLVARYSWVAITLGLAFGFLLGIILKPSRHSLGHAQI